MSKKSKHSRRNRPFASRKGKRAHKVSPPARAHKRTSEPLTAYLEKFKRAQLERSSISTPCGACDICCRSGYEVTPEEGDNLSLFTGRTPDEKPILPLSEDGSCGYLGEEGCTVYERRPTQCRLYDCRPMAIAGFRYAGNARAELNAVIDRWDPLDMLKTHEDEVAWGAVKLAAMKTYESMPSPCVETAACAAMIGYPPYLQMTRMAIQEINQLSVSQCSELLRCLGHD